MALKRSRSETLAPSPLINLLSFNLSATDTINLSASQLLWGPRCSCKAYHFKAQRVIDSSKEGTADKSDSPQRSSKDNFRHKGTEQFRKRCSFKLRELRGRSVVREGLIFGSFQQFLYERVSARAKPCIDPMNKSGLVQIVSFYTQVGLTHAHLKQQPSPVLNSYVSSQF